MTCTKCELHKTCKHIQIGSRGSENPKILFVGDAPGEMEDERGMCFVGPAGQLLTQAIQEYSLKPCRLTSVVRCFPPDDRDPKAVEVAACKPYLMEEINKYKPDFIVALGNIPLRALTGKNGISSYSGNIVGQIDESKVFALYHPNYVLRYPAILHRFEAHLRTLVRVVGQEKRLDPVKVRYLDCDMAKEILSRQVGFVTFDFETNGKYKQYGGRITCVGFTVNDDVTFVVEAKGKEFDDFMKWFLTTDFRKCAFNSIFELRWCLDMWGKEPKNLVYDPYLMHYLYDENSSHALDSVAGQILEVESWDIAHLMKENKWDWDNVPMQTLMKYCGLDTHYTHRLVKTLGEKLKGQGLVKNYEQYLLPLSRLCARLAHRGLKIDLTHANKFRHIYDSQAEKLLDKLIKIGKLDEGFNPNSPLQIAKALKKLKIKTTERTDSGEMSVKASALEPLENKHPFVKTYLEWKEKKILSNNFLTEYPKLVDSRGLIHPSFNPAKIVTTRIACSDPSAQNIPNDENVRGMIISRFDDGLILSNDYKQLELRLVASEAKEPRMLRLFEQGVDLHDVTAREMFGDNFTDQERKIAKNINFGTVYGISEYGLAHKFNVSTEVALNWIKKFKQLNPYVFKWMDLQHSSVKMTGYLRSQFGQYRRLPDAKSKDWKRAKRALRQAGNFPIQAQGASITNLAAVLIDRALTASTWKSTLVHIVHDAILIDVYPGEQDMVRQLCKVIMQKEIRRYTPWLKVELPISQEISKRWGGKDDQRTAVAK